MMGDPGCNGTKVQSFTVYNPIYVHQGWCLLLLLRIRSVHLEILRFPIGDAYQYRDIFARFKIMQRK